MCRTSSCKVITSLFFHHLCSSLEREREREKLPLSYMGTYIDTRLLRSIISKGLHSGAFLCIFGLSAAYFKVVVNQTHLF